MKRYITPILLLFACLSFAVPVEALTKAEADKAYRERNYQQAITDYEHLLKAGESASLYYNLGNAYFRTDNVTKAILNYERALLLDPGNRDIRFNLQFAKSKTIDKFADADEMFFVTWYREIVNFMSVDGWAITSIFTIILALLGFLVYLFIDAVMLKKVGFFASLTCLVLFVLSIVFAWQQENALENRTGAVIVSPTVYVRKTPSKAKTESDEFVIHEGTKVEMIDKSMKGWREIRLPDGREGWIPVSSLEEI